MGEVEREKQKAIEIGSLLKGHLRFAILKALEKEPLHGYAIINRIAELTTVWKPTTGSIYPMLVHMQGEKLVSMKTIGGNNRKKKVYCLTKNGKQKLKEQQRMVEPMIKNLSKMFQKMLPEGELGADRLLDIFSKSDFARKEIVSLKQNIIAFMILKAKGKITPAEEQKAKEKIVGLNDMLSGIIRKKG